VIQPPLWPPHHKIIDHPPLERVVPIGGSAESSGVWGRRQPKPHDHSLAIQDILLWQMRDMPAKSSRHITNEVRGINRIVYDSSSKPPSTIEWA
jgi:hypothetical protein